ncbi:MAG: 6-carboxytetrahydropterin synthase [Lachnospiraceae bacterium]|nr:6-carboxytetrahydropterin synthase [Lachnospiraceae bacterium]
MFRGYKLKFEFNAAHSNVDNHTENAHFHTFTIVLYLHDLDERMDYFFDIEKNINEWLSPYQDTYLYETELFKGKSTTLESIGDTFYDLWYEKLQKLQFDLVRLDIFENPIRMYSVSDRILDADVNELGTLPNAFYNAVEFDKKEDAVQVKVPVMAAEMTKEEVKESIEEADEDPVMAMPEEEKMKRAFLKKAMGTLLVAVMAAVIIFVLKNYGNYPAGSDTYCHLYRADVILQNLRMGNLFPLYDPGWYNGVEIMRYWGPLPLYVLAFTQWLGGNMFVGYIFYIGVLFVIGALGFMALGKRLNRWWLGVFVGIIWFFLPENMKVIFYDGNMPRALINALSPLLICMIYDLTKQKSAVNLLKLSLLFTAFSFCHIGSTIILVVVLLVYLLVYSKVNKEWKTMGNVLLCVLTGMMISGVWMMPSFHGSGAGGSNNQVMEGFFQSAFVSLNPMPAWRGQTLFYFGLSLFLLCLLGLILGNKKTLPGFATGMIIFLLTTNSAYDILSKMPFSSYLWMMRFVSTSLVFVMAAFMLWKGLKKQFVFILCLVLVLDCVPVVRYLSDGSVNERTVEEINDIRGDELLMNQAKAITNQRMTVFDLSSYGAFAPYYAAGVERKVPYMFGAGWEGARTAENIVMLNTAVETGCYDYVFDRCIEMGTDTLVFVIAHLQNEENDIPALIASGETFGYTVVVQNEQNILMHKETPACFGVVTKYPYLAIGHAADEIALLYPAFEEGKSDNLSEYEYEELTKYDIIYLSDFAYDDKEEAEALLMRLSEDGTRIYIDMNKIPVDKQTNIQEIFGVSVQGITYNNSFPVITYRGEPYKTSGFPESYKEWKANYLIGLEKVTGSGDINGKELAFAGTKDNENIIFLGYNFVYYTELTKDTVARQLLDDVFGITAQEMPERTLVELDISYGTNRISIKSPVDGVNTTLADIVDIFESDREYANRHHMITVDKGKTTIFVHYPYLGQGITVTVLGMLILTGMMIQTFIRRRRSDSV